MIDMKDMAGSFKLDGFDFGEKFGLLITTALTTRTSPMAV